MTIDTDAPEKNNADTDVEVTESTGLELFINPAGTRLAAHFQPVPNSAALSEEQILAMIAEQGYSEEDYPIYPDRLKDLVIGIRQRRSFEIEIGGPTDGDVSIYFAQDKTLAGVRILPPSGKGLPLSRQLFDSALQKARIYRGLDHELIEKIMSDEALAQVREEQCYLIAFGQKPKNGQDSELVPLTEQISERRPKVINDQIDQVDFRELGDFPVVEVETPLFRLTEPVAGEDGFSLSGKPIKAYQGKEKKLKLDSSVKPSYEDRRVYISTVKGMPVFTEQGVHVEQVLKLDEINMGTGNIRFDGSVLVKKGVNPGMLLEATGDIKVGGLVDNATVISGGNVEIVGGIIGQKSPSLKADAPTKENAVVRAKGNVKARFIQDAWVESNGSISAQKLIMHSRLWAAHQVKLAGAGQLVGGHVIAGTLIEAGQLGTLASVPTILEVGPLDAIREEVIQVQNKLKEGAAQMKQLRDLIHRIKEEKRKISPEKKEQILKARDTISNVIAALELRRSELEQEVQTRKKGRVRGIKKAHSGCNIIISDVSRILKEDFGKTTFYLEGTEILLR
ncbi:Protein of unknown function [Oceanospirillum multiglobuliferum]|uniref:Flagellar Assembly Protein A N-terminal region domain-containing protein n=1 Tax=Oceanospirillum multiglobuliferum TaxID=64969 RepID=A0A1T4PZI4_9GAMM|nr:FapA family protein [Oceanospirillum multiglobuliferum]OPX55425.1 hypothetical protein BTE48_08510 [Oceanospirillum multiglobuliferum]SJZ96378.1 Protein of unknown function [Oceanospirillum multiglobuliferum]